MDRSERADEVYERLFGPRDPAVVEDDPELMAILRGLIFGDIFAIGGLDDRTRELITVIVLTVNQTLPQLRSHVGAALNVGVTPLELREALYTCATFIGFPRTLNALAVANEVFRSRGIEVPLPDAGTVGPDERLERGREHQAPLYGTNMAAGLADVPDGLGAELARLLTECGFGDFYTRSGLDLPTRELLVLVILAALGDTPVQIASHGLGNLKLGTSKATLVAAMIHAFPYMGFPRAVNAVRILKDLPDEAASA